MSQSKCETCGAQNIDVTLHESTARNYLCLNGHRSSEPIEGVTPAKPPAENKGFLRRLFEGMRVTPKRTDSAVR